MPENGGPLALEHRQDDLQGLAEPVEAVGEGAEVVAQRVVLQLEPPGADAEYRAALADHVQRGDRLREQCRVAVGVAGDERAELDALGRRRERAQGGVGLEHRLVGGAEAGQLIEVVHHEDGVVARGFGLLGLRDDGGEECLDAGAVGEVGDLESESNRHEPDPSQG